MTTGKNVRLLQKRAEILHQEQVGPLYFKMRLAFAELAQMARPGQFVMVRLPGMAIPFLRRPFSIYNPFVAGDEICGFELLYKVVGSGTRALSEQKPGDGLDVLGPLGNGFSCAEGIHNVFLVAGGIGVASLFYLALFLKTHREIRSTVFLGGRAAADILCQQEFKTIGARVCITTEDGSLGKKGLITSLVERTLEDHGKPDMVYACGPTKMLKALKGIVHTYDVSCQISLETAMACGFGACLGCAVKKANGTDAYFHACIDGPVFDARHIA